LSFKPSQISPADCHESGRAFFYMCRSRYVRKTRTLPKLFVRLTYDFG